MRRDCSSCIWYIVAGNDSMLRLDHCSCCTSSFVNYCPENCLGIRDEQEI